MFVRILTLSLWVLAAGCASTIRGAARQASAAAVDEAVEQVTSDDSLRGLAEAVDDPKIARATTELADQVTKGVLQSLSSELSSRQIAALTQMLAATATAAVMEQVAYRLKTELAPAMVELVRDNGQSASNELSAQLQPALGTTARTVGYNAVLGANQGIDEIWLGSDAKFGDLKELGSRVSAWLWLAVAVLGLLTLSLLFGAVIAIARAHRARTEVTRLESATLLLATAMREKQQSAETDEIVTIVQEALSRGADSHGRGTLLDALRMRRHH